ncbi:MAG: chemotaxis protein CheB [Deltaproteobacteria bacterium]|nr:chemotaxis protein CheB [Deltaproteobacteria bacterium]
MIKVVIVDDSMTARLALRRALEKDPAVLIVGEAATGSQAMKMIRKVEPDLVTMDVFLEEENGLDVAAWIMAEFPRPIIVVTGVNPSDPRLLYKALEKGALEVFPKLPSPTNRRYEEQRSKLVRLVKNLSSVPVLHRSRRASKSPRRAFKSESAPPMPTARQAIAERTSFKILLIGASTGGPPVISDLLQALPSPFPIPIVVVQHISEGFGKGFANWLGQVGGFRSKLVEKREELEPGTVYVAPDDQNMRFASIQYLTPTEVGDANAIRPSVNVLFSSGARHFGASAIAVLMTGMGRDGSQGMKDLFDAGSFTIAQSMDTCAVDSMPRSAIGMNAVDAVLTPEDIAKTITRKVALFR